mgnify:CR=1 FL=1
MSILNRRGTPDPGDSFTPSKFNTPRPITASAVRVNLKDKREVEGIAKRRLADAWQEEGWEYYDLITEIKASANLIASVLSRINLYAAFVNDSSTIPSRIDTVEGLDPEFITKVTNALYLLESGNGGTSGLLRNAALNLFVAGECYLVKEPPLDPNDAPKWQIRSVSEVITSTTRDPISRKSVKQVAIKPRKDSKPKDYIKLPDNSYCGRIWRNHPQYSDEADSSVRGLLEICDELLLISRMARTAAKSRLNAGILFIPDELSNMSQTDSDEGVDMSNDIGEAFEEELSDAIMGPIEDENAGTAVVPVILRGDAEMGQYIRYIQIERAYDPLLNQRIDNLIDRILGGLDIPSDVAKGLSGVKYSNAILIEEQLYKAHVEPMVLMIVDALTVGFLRPALRAMNKFEEEDIQRAVVWYDPSAITAKPSKSEAATIGLENGSISRATWRRAHGFSDSDAASPLEIAQRFAEKQGMMGEAMTEKLISTMVPPEVLAELRAEQLAESGESGEALADAISTEPTVTTEGTPPEASAPEDGTPPPTGLLEP